MLFSNPTIAKVMNEDFVPHWVNVRDVPKVTIDFGKGRVLERTLNGNIATYICLPDGRTLDVITGLNDEATYLRRLQEGLELYRAVRKLPNLREAVLSYHEVTLGSDHASGLRAIREGKKASFLAGLTTVTYGGDLKGVARYEETLAVTKAAVEGPLKRAIAIDPGLPQERLSAAQDRFPLSPISPTEPNPFELGLLNGESTAPVDEVLTNALAKGMVEEPLKRALTDNERAREFNPASKKSVERPLKLALANKAKARDFDPAAKGMVERPLKRALTASDSHARDAFSKFKVEAPLKKALKKAPRPVLARTKREVEAPLKKAVVDRGHLSAEKAALVKKAKPTLDADSKNNETTRRLQIHRLLLLRPLQQPAALAEVVYRDVMHVDITDPFLGLAPKVIGGEIGRHGVSEK